MLTPADKEALINAFDSFSVISKDFYMGGYSNEALQGDGWPSFFISIYKSESVKNTKGIVLSNTCDISPENQRDMPKNLVFAPIVKLSEYEIWLKKSGINVNSISDKIGAIKEQRVSNIFYLPENNQLGGEYIALFDRLSHMPASEIKTMLGQVKLFTLSQFGFYYFLFKISHHFCRLPEGLHR